MKFFNKNELIAIVIILGLIAAVSFNNFKASLRRGRDAQRKADMNQLATGIQKYQEDFGYYPPSEDGKIVACEDESVEVTFEELEDSDLTLNEKLNMIYRPCEWGEDSLRDVNDLSYPAYIENLPSDPVRKQGGKYLYFSTLNHFQVYSYLEGQEEEDEYEEGIVERQLDCGLGICNFGASSGSAPLDKSLQEYENELKRKESK